jgi:type II secretory pathway pseudopilin PulG
VGISLIIAGISAAVGTVSLVQGMEARSDAKKNLARQQAEERKIQSETKAQQAQRAADERRAQVREERVKRARVLASSGGSGGAGSSGEFGALGALGTNLASNIGTNLGKAQSGSNISDYSQNAADFAGKAQGNLMDAQTADSMFNLSTSIFSASGGPSAASSIFKTDKTPMPLTSGGVQ